MTVVNLYKRLCYNRYIHTYTHTYQNEIKERKLKRTGVPKDAQCFGGKGDYFVPLEKYKGLVYQFLIAATNVVI